MLCHRATPAATRGEAGLENSAGRGQSSLQLLLSSSSLRLAATPSSDISSAHFTVLVGEVCLAC